MSTRQGAGQRPRDWQEGTALVLAVLILNILDLCLTVTWMELGLAAEANPVMRLALERGLLVFASFKLGLVVLCLVVLVRFQDHLLARVGLRVSFVVYLSLLVYHGQGLILWSTMP